MSAFPCPCCGFLVFDEVGSFDNCPVCRWEDDLSQLRFPRETGANRVALIEAQQNFIRSGTSDPSRESDFGVIETPLEKDPEWRPIAGTDPIEDPVAGVDYGETYPGDPTQLYYWRRSFWRRPVE